MATPTPFLITGQNGLIGSKLVEAFGQSYSFEGLDISHPTHPVDITNYDQVLAVFDRSAAEFIVHFAAFTDVTAAWQQQGDTNGLAYKVNVVGTENIVKAATATSKHVIHISTAFVFDGTKTTPYTEADPVSPIEWYGETKAKAEAAVQASNSAWTILRIDFPFRSDAFAKPDIVRKTIASIDKGYPLFANHFFGPTYIDDLVKVIDWVVRTKTTGLFNASNGETWSDYELGMLINEVHQLGKDIKKGDLDEYLKTQQRPYQRNTSLDCSKLFAQLDFTPKTIRQAIAEVTL